MINYSALARSLPCRADREQIVQQANRVLTEARLVAEQSDRTLALLAAERPAGCTTASALLLTVAATLDAFPAGR